MVVRFISCCLPIFLAPHLTSRTLLPSSNFKCPCSQDFIHSLRWQSNLFTLLSSAILMLMMLKSVSPTQYLILSARQHRYLTGTQMQYIQTRTLIFQFPLPQQNLFLLCAISLLVNDILCCGPQTACFQVQ